MQELFKNANIKKQTTNKTHSVIVNNEPIQNVTIQPSNSTASSFINKTVSQKINKPKEQKTQ